MSETIKPGWEKVIGAADMTEEEIEQHAAPVMAAQVWVHTEGVRIFAGMKQSEVIHRLAAMCAEFAGYDDYEQPPVLARLEQSLIASDMRARDAFAFAGTLLWNCALKAEEVEERDA